MSARDAAIAAVGERRGRGRPRRFDATVHVPVDEDLRRRVEAFAEVEQISNAEAWRTLTTLGLTALERRN